MKISKGPGSVWLSNHHRRNNVNPTGTYADLESRKSTRLFMSAQTVQVEHFSAINSSHHTVS